MKRPGRRSIILFASGFIIVLALFFGLRWFLSGRKYVSTDDAFIDALANNGIAYVPFFPLGGLSPLQSSVLDRVAASMQATPMQVALAWFLHRSANILLIPGTSSIEHLRENLDAARLELPSDAIADLNSMDKSAASGYQGS